MQVEGLMSANMCLQNISQFQRLRLQHVQLVNKTSSFKTKLIGNNAGANRISRNTL